MPILELKSISKTFQQPGGVPLKAVDDVSLAVDAGECLAIVGESGSGKSTLARIALCLIRPDAGDILLNGRSLRTMPSKELRRHRLTMQPVFQDPTASFNPRRNVRSSMAQALAQCAERDADPRARMLECLAQVGLRPPEDFIERYPHELSGGQRQRLAIARALAVRPQLIIADEPLSGADVSIRAQILNLLIDLQRTRNLGYLLITHDMLVARAVAHRIAVMHRGRIVEQGPAETIMAYPRDPYTVRLLRAVQSVDAGSREHDSKKSHHALAAAGREASNNKETGRC